MPLPLLPISRPAAAAIVLALLLPGAASGDADEPRIVHTTVISEELKVAIAEGDIVFLYAKPLPGEGINAFVRRFTDDPATKEEILSLNRRASVLKRGVFVRVPYALLSGNYQKIAMQALFPGDSAASGAWLHPVSAPGGAPESLWRIAEWFTGKGENYGAIRKASGLASLETEKGQTVRIPATLLLAPFREEVESREEAGPLPLTYGKDDSGRYAAYRLRRGEALYSAVVVRFTGLLHAADVNAEAEKIAARSGIRDVRSIPVGHEIRIPIDDLLPDYLPVNDPRRAEYDRSRMETAQFVNRIRAANLRGVTVVLDPGHGGRDTGVYVSNVAESRYAFDIASRIAELLKRHTQARVVMTVEDPDIRKIPREDRLPVSFGGEVMTTPPYPIDDTVAGVHLRWYLANSILRSAVHRDGDDARVVFISIHADSLHPSVRGAMVYIPGEKFLKGSFGKSGPVYRSRKEFRQAPRVSFSRRERLEAEGVSRDLAEKIITAFRKDALPVHDYNPIRENVIRRGREWVPAVLRYNEIPARVLLEVCNLNNDDDLKLIQTRRYRERVAQGVIEALTAFYDGDSSQRASTAAAERRRLGRH